MADYAGLVKRIASQNGCKYLRNAKGSHEMWINPSNSKVTAIPHKIKSKDMANAIFKQLGINQKI